MSKAKPQITVTPYDDAPRGQRWWEYEATNGTVFVRGYRRGTRREATAAARASLEAAETMERQRL